MPASAGADPITAGFGKNLLLPLALRDRYLRISKRGGEKQASKITAQYVEYF